MNVAKFSKVSYEQFKEGVESCFPHMAEGDKKRIYDNIVLPERATKSSAGYDFHSPVDFSMKKGGVLTIPTGIRCEMNEGWSLWLLPRSGHGFKYGVGLANTVGIIDSDYYFANNEGHIFVKLVVNENVIGDKEFSIKEGDAFCQGIFVPYGMVGDDTTDGERIGGFGSTDEK